MNGVNMCWTTTILFLIFSFLSETKSTYDCIQGCACEHTEQGIVADCRGVNLTSVPKSYYGNKINVLYLQYNRISRIRSNDFLDYENLIELNMQGNRINTIEDKAFEGLHSLRKLDLSRNMIKNIPEKEIEILRDNLEWLSLSMNAISKLPNLENHTNLTYLNLSNNIFIKDIFRESFPSSLTKLDLQYTAVKHFKKGSFSHLHSLRTLRLNDNMASASVRFESNVFDDLLSLEYLDLSRCFCKRLPYHAFVKLTNINTLKLNNCWLGKPPIFGSHVRDQAVFNNIKLTHLDLSNNRRMSIRDTKELILPPSLIELKLSRINFPVIGRNIFKNLNQLKLLDLCRSRVKSIDLYSFQHLYELEKVCLSGNSFEDLPILPGSLVSLNISDPKLRNITKISLQSLENVLVMNLRKNEIEWIEDRALEGMTSLRYLDLSQNKLRSIRRKSFSVTPKTDVNSSSSSLIGSPVLSLNLSINEIRKIESRTFANYQNLHLLDLQGNFVKRISSGCFDGLDNLKTLNLNRNLIRTIEPGTLNFLHKLEILHMEENQLAMVFSGTFSTLSFLKHLNLAGNELMYSEDFLFSSLETLDVTFNNFNRFPLIAGENLKEIRSAWNFFKRFDDGALDLTPNLEYLDISHSNLKQIDYKVFQSTPGLLELDLTGNKILKFVDEKMSALESLWMSENRIDIVDQNIKEFLPNIKYLDLSYNNMTSIQSEVFEQTLLANLDLSGNNFHCDCELQSFVRWMKKKSDILIESEFYLCESPPEFYALPIIDTVDEFTCGEIENTSEDSKALFYLVLAAIAVATVFLLMITALLVVYRKLKSRRNSKQTSSIEEGMNCRKSFAKCCFHSKNYTLGRKVSSSSSSVVKESTASSSTSSTADAEP